MTLAIILLIVGLIAGGGLGYTMMPPKIQTTTVTQTVKEIPLKGKEIQLGFIAPDDSGLETGKPMHDIMAADENAYLKMLGYGTTVKWLIDNAQESANLHLEKVQGFRTLGITVVQGGGWSSQAGGSLDYTNANKMILWSWSSTSPTYAIANDSLYRMCPNDNALAPGLAAVMWDYGIKAAMIIVRADAWGDGIVNIFKVQWERLGGQYTGDPIRYDPATKEFTNYLQVADTQAQAANDKYGAEHVGVVVLSFSEAAILGSQASQYPNYYKLKTFDSDGAAFNTRLLTDSPQAAVDQIYYSLMAGAPSTTKWNNLEDRYEPVANLQLSAYDAFMYDIGTVVIDSMLQAQSQNAQDIIKLQSTVSGNTYGVGGWCLLQDTGDRAPPVFNIWGYVWSADHTIAEDVLFGTFDGSTGQVTWDMAKLNQYGYTLPGK